MTRSMTLLLLLALAILRAVCLGAVPCLEHTGDDLDSIGFVPVEPSIRIPLGQPSLCSHGDFNEDGVVDLVIGTVHYADSSDEESVGHVSVLLGLGCGRFGPPYLIDSFSHVGDLRVAWALSADIDHDRHQDLVITYAAQEAWTVQTVVVVLVGDGRGVFVEAERKVSESLFVPLLATDVTGDRIPDLVAVDLLGDSIYLATGSAKGVSLDFRVMVSLEAWRFPHRVQFVDVDEDGELDIAIAGFRCSVEERRCWRYLGVGRGNPGWEVADLTYVELPEPEPSRRPVNLVLGDVDGSASLDLIFTGPERAYVASFDVEEALVLCPIDGAWIEDPRAELRVAYLDGDKRVDYVIRRLDGTVQILLTEWGAESRNVVLMGITFFYSRAYAIDVADVDGDSREDVVVVRDGTADTDDAEQVSIVDVLLNRLHVPAEGVTE